MIVLVMNRPRLVVIAAIVFCLLLGSVTVGVVFVPSSSPCHERTSTAPQIAFNITYNTSTETLTVVHNGGDRLTEENSNSLTIRIRPEEAEDYSTRYVLADAKGGYPVEENSTWTFPDASINNRPLSDGDVIRVVWTGPDDIPSYCPNYHEEESTVAKRVIGED
ncbi:MAG: hypothetical protein ACI80F_002797 [Natronomonas sp.]|jgi:hypothetical protein